MVQAVLDRLIPELAILTTVGYQFGREKANRRRQ